MFDGALGSLQGASTEAVNCLKRNLTCGIPSAEVHAARTILDYIFKAREMFDFEARIAQLERALKDREEAERDGIAFSQNEEEMYR